LRASPLLFHLASRAVRGALAAGIRYSVFDAVWAVIFAMQCNFLFEL